MIFYSHQPPLDPSVQAERQPLFVIHDNDPFYHKRKRGRLVGKRELAEKHWCRGRFYGSFVFRGNWAREGVINVPPKRPYPNLPTHKPHYKRDWKGQRRWIQEETAYERDDLENVWPTKSTATYRGSKPPKYR
ncbi:Sec1 family protein [Apiospora arundinis]